MCFLVKMGVKVAKVGLVLTFYLRLLLHLIRVQGRQLVVGGLRLRQVNKVCVHQSLNYCLHGFKLLIKFGII